MEAFGYVVRGVSTKHLDNSGLYIAQFILIILAPVVMAAGFYIIFVSSSCAYDRLWDINLIVLW